MNTLTTTSRKLSGGIKVPEPEGEESNRSEEKGADVSASDSKPKIMNDSHSREENADLESNHSTDSKSEPSIIAKGPVFAEASSTQGYHPQDVPHTGEEETTTEEKDTSGELAEEDGKQDQGKADSGESAGNEAHANILSDSSGADDAISAYNTQQGSTISSAYLAFPPTPLSEGMGGRPQPRRLSTLFDSLRPVSNSSSTVELPLLHAKNPLHSKIVTTIRRT